MKTAAIISKPAKPELQQIIPEVVRWFSAHKYRVVGDEETASYFSGIERVDREKIALEKPEFALVLGGDGTLLSAARSISAAGIPILAVNLGSLGFLTEVPLAELYQTLEKVEECICPVEERAVIECHHFRGDQRVGSYYALNDVVVNKSAIARLVGFDLFINNSFVLHYKADGVIVSTPTGSTAYSLAAGGPVLMPAVNAFVITPVCPHSLTHRPLVVEDNAEVVIVVKSDEEEAFLTIDGQIGTPVHREDRIHCKKASYSVKLLRMRKTFFDVLRSKLKWGQR